MRRLPAVDTRARLLLALGLWLWVAVAWAAPSFPELTGRVVMALCRGQVVARDGKPCGQAGDGQFLRCDKPTPARPRGQAKGF